MGGAEEVGMRESEWRVEERKSQRRDAETQSALRVRREEDK